MNLDVELYRQVRVEGREAAVKRIHDIRDSRECYGIKQGEVALKMGAAQTNVSALEKDGGPYYSVKLAVRYIQAAKELINTHEKRKGLTDEKH